MLSLHQNLSPLQRRTMSITGSSFGICAALSMSLHQVPLHHFAAVTYGVIALIGATPIIMTIIALGQYLVRETDEYVRSVVVQSLLWGFGLVMILDTVLGYLIAFASMDSIHLRSLGVFNLEIFVITAAIALRIQLWRNR
jgi:hypothetical protein